MVTQTTDRSATNLVEALSGLSPEGMELITSLIRQMGGTGNDATQRIKKPADGIPHGCPVRPLRLAGCAVLDCWAVLLVLPPFK